jgi:CheY-like chemotaxis protein
VILCDLDMPAMGGLEFHRRLAESLPKEAARVVFMTGGNLGARAEAFFAQAPNMLLDKPLELEGVLALIDRRIRGGADDQADVSLSA